MIKITQLFRIEASGDWHDAPLKWQVAGPNQEVQKFGRKADAKLYAKIRRKASTQAEAINAFVRS